MTPYLVCYSSQTGTSKKLAVDFAHEIEQTIDHDRIPTEENMFEVKNISEIEKPEDLSCWILICFFISSYGDGEQCSDGEQFYNSLRHLENDFFKKRGKQCEFTMFGCGNSLYDSYQGAANNIQKELSRLSFHEIGKFGKGDDGCNMLMEDYDEWKLDTISLLQKLLKFPLVQRRNEYISQFEVTESDEAEAVLFDKSTGPPYHEDNPFFARIKNIEVLTNNEFDVKKVVRVSFDLEQKKTNLRYTTGDHIAVYPSNSESDVRSFLKLVGLWHKRNQIVRIIPVGHSIRPFYPIPCSYFNICKYYLEINASPSRKMIHFIANTFTEDDAAKQSLVNITSNAETFAKNVTSRHLTISKLLEPLGYKNFNIPITFFMESFGKLKPRYYSISSSSLEFSDMVDMTVSLDKDSDSHFEGVFSKELERILDDKRTSEICQIDTRLPIFMETSKFRLPINSKKPILLICAGVGVAPFRAFIREIALKSKNAEISKIYLYYGLRRQDEDFLYFEELNEIKKKLDGMLEVNIAESRGAGPKVYVQNLLERDRSKIGDLCIKNNACIYVCGRAKTMGRGVSKTLIDIFSDIKGGIRQGDNYLKLMKILGRYREDIW